MARQYVTTAIDFPNAAPHMGHVMEKIIADTAVRWFRLRGDEVRFHVGTDENGIKIQQAAKAKEMTPKELVDQNAPVFERLFRELDISFDYFIRTSSQTEHWPTVEALWRALRNAGVLEKRTYKGLYCVGCERFVTAKDLVDGLCPDHKTPPEEVEEENWFYTLSQRRDDVLKLLKDQSYQIVPRVRANEILSFLEQGLEDISFSRSRKTLQWGVPVPEDPDQVMYVWCDNLTSYISSLHYLRSDAMTEWWDDAQVTHVIGKDIARFHAVNWPAMLLDAGIKTPDRLLIHGFLTSEGQKMSKSIGNVVVPQEVIAKYGVDPLRFYLSHEVSVGNDGDFSWKRFQELYDAKLRNDLGNMLNRVMVMLGKLNTDLRQGTESIGPFVNIWARYEESMNGFDLQAALALVLHAVSDLNRLFNEAAPWKEEPVLQIVTLSTFAEALRHVSLMLLPFMPRTAQKIARQLNVPYADRMLEREFVIDDRLKAWGSQVEWKRVEEPEILFAPVEP